MCLNFEILYINQPEYDEVIDKYLPILAKYTMFQKMEMSKFLYQFFIQVLISLVRVIYHVEKRFEEEDKTKFFKTMEKSINKTSLTTIQWSEGEELDQSLKEIKQQNESVKKPGRVKKLCK